MVSPSRVRPLYTSRYASGCASANAANLGSFAAAANKATMSPHFASRGTDSSLLEQGSPFWANSLTNHIWAVAGDAT